MSTDPMTMLLVEDSTADALLLRKMLGISPIAYFDLIQVGSLAEARTAMREHKIDVVLLDLTLPDTHNLETLRAMRLAAPHEPIVVLTGVEDESLVMQAMREGAEDYLVKGQVDANLLARAIRYAIERRYAREEASKIAAMLADAQRIAHLGNWERNLLTGESYWSDEMYGSSDLRLIQSLRLMSYS